MIHAQHKYAVIAHLTTRYIHKIMEINRMSGLSSNF